MISADELDAARTLISLALAEDLASAGDRTTLALIPESQTARAKFVARSPGVIAGLPIVELVMASFSPPFQGGAGEGLSKNDKQTFTTIIPDGSKVHRGDVIAHVSGSLRSILVAERTALNFLQQLSGVATLT